jgi:hypothetical protein
MEAEAAIKIYNNFFKLLIEKIFLPKEIIYKIGDFQVAPRRISVKINRHSKEKAWDHPQLPSLQMISPL